MVPAVSSVVAAIGVSVIMLGCISESTSQMSSKPDRPALDLSIDDIVGDVVAGYVPVEPDDILHMTSMVAMSVSPAPIPVSSPVVLMYHVCYCNLT